MQLQVVLQIVTLLYFLNLQKNLFESLNGHHLVIYGDIGLPEKIDRSTELILLMSTYDFRSVVTRLAHINTPCLILLDLFMTNINNLDTTAAVLVSDISGHLRTCAFIDFPSIEKGKNPKKQFEMLTLKL